MFVSLLSISTISYYNGNMSVGETTGTDLSIARISTDLSVR